MPWIRDPCLATPRPRQLDKKIASSYLVSWTRSLKENLRKLARLSQTTQILSLYFCKQSEILALSGTI